MLTDSATSPPDRNTITVEAVPLATLPTRIMPAATCGGIASRCAIAHAASGMMR